MRFLVEVVEATTVAESFQFGCEAGELSLRFQTRVKGTAVPLTTPFPSGIVSVLGSTGPFLNSCFRYRLSYFLLSQPTMASISAWGSGPAIGISLDTEILWMILAALAPVMIRLESAVVPFDHAGMGPYGLPGK